MTRIGRRTLLASSFATSALATSALPAPALAQPSWPSRGITWVVPFAAGGITDSSSRVVAHRLSQILGQPVVVENRPGAGGTIGTEAVARAAPDGHTLLYGSQGPIAAAPALYPALRYDPKRDFVPVQGLGASPNMVVTSPGRPWRSMAELVAAARATASAPMVPPAPGRFSTTTGWPRICDSRWATTREELSVMPPAAKGTTQVMPRLGQGVSARARPGVASVAASRLRRAIRTMVASPFRSCRQGITLGAGSRRLR